MKYALLGLIGLLILAGLWVRLAPDDPALWHVFPENADPRIPDTTSANARLSHRSYGVPPAQILARLDEIARATPRTRILAGGVEDGMITYVTRSALWGFPDYTTAIAQADDRGGTVLTLHARARFGSSDLGVNGKRVDAWLNALAP